MTHSNHDTNPSPRAHWIVTLVAALLLSLVAGGPSPLRAKETELPSGEKILDGYVKATGGKKVRQKLNNRVTVASLDLAAQGIQLQMTIHSARPNRNYTLVASEFTGKIEKGTDGTTVWEMSDMLGAQIKEGVERADFLREANFDRFEVWRELYKDVQCSGLATVDGSPAYEVRLTPVDGHPQKMYFDTETHLLVKHEFTLENAMGKIPVTSYVSDYRDVDGVLLPFKIKAEVMGQERVLNTESIQHNVDLPDDRFELPEEIRRLLDDADATTEQDG